MSIERRFEAFLWNSRLVVLVAVVASVIVSCAMFFVATIDVVELVRHLGAYADFHLAPEARMALRAATVTHVVEVVDGYLLAAIMLIFALGLYELFVSRIEAAEGSEFASRLLLIRSMDDLKNRLAKVVLLILVVKFFEYALQISIESAVELLYLALGTLLVSGALWLSHSKESVPPHRPANEPTS